MPIPSGLQDLSPWAARLCLRVESFTRSLIPEVFGDIGGTGGTGGIGGIGGDEGIGDRFPARSLVLAVSGGLDSTALAVIFTLLAPRLGLTLTAAHLDHRLRPDSGLDAKFCAAFCADLGLACHTRAVDVAALAGTWRTGIEDAGRRARQAWLEEVRCLAGGSMGGSAGALAVATGHQLNDLAEDQLLRLIRGAGWPALGGMTAWDPDRRLLRPLLMTPKADLRRLLEELGVAWREDETNADPAFTRNRVRRDILPLLVRENPDYLDACAERWRQARLDDIHWNEAMAAALLLRTAGNAPRARVNR